MHEIQSVLLVVLSCLIGTAALITLAVAIWSTRWPSVKGTVDNSIYDVEGDSSASDGSYQKTGKFYLTYTYTRQGEIFQDSRIKPLWEIDWQIDGVPEFSGAKDKSQWYGEGTLVDVYYCPFYPSWVCLEPGGFFPGIYLTLVSAYLFWVR